jgi:hypothetical protein
MVAIGALEGILLTLDGLRLPVGLDATSNSVTFVLLS